MYITQKDRYILDNDGISTTALPTYYYQGINLHSIEKKSIDSIYQINQHLHDIISDEILGVIQKNVAIVSFQIEAAQTDSDEIHHSITSHSVTSFCGSTVLFQKPLWCDYVIVLIMRLLHIYLHTVP